ncbi:MAG: DUF1778 domain-containing protein [Synergistaceae bacterium]|nr:DUF1778 domain-containing protein [Synergistaceae bacterium]
MPNKTDRVIARVPADIKQRWQNAAAMRGQTLTDFLVVAANKATDEIFETENRIELSAEEQMALAELLLNPPEINEAMKEALTRRMAHIAGI